MKRYLVMLMIGAMTATAAHATQNPRDRNDEIARLRGEIATEETQLASMRERLLQLEYGENRVARAFISGMSPDVERNLQNPNPAALPSPKIIYTQGMGSQFDIPVGEYPILYLAHLDALGHLLANIVYLPFPGMVYNFVESMPGDRELYVKTSNIIAVACPRGKGPHLANGKGLQVLHEVLGAPSPTWF
ncbi:MAG: hypothetical protein LBJ69_00065 [Holosporales bacterium]|jgi:hypothetical protein|nr:hypothetical protein [Holosporales bacterium]